MLGSDGAGPQKGGASIMAWISEQAATLVAQFGSPLYVYDAALIEEAFRRFQGAFRYEPLECHYAIVCNKNHYIVRLLSTLGAGIHANTPGDAYSALRAGVPGRRIVYSGTNLNAADLDWLLEHDVQMNVDSLDQLRDLAARQSRSGAGLRLLIDDERSGNRIGVTAAELPLALEICRRAGVRLAGLHMYAGTNTLRAGRFLQCFDRMLDAARELPDLEYLDLGGGFGVAYEERRAPFPVAELGAEISARMETLSAGCGRRIRLLLEPGRILVAEAGCLLMTVVSVKSRGARRYVGVDSTVGNVVVESVYHSYHGIEAVAPRGPALDVSTDVCGNTTHSRDFIARGCRLPDLQPGDLLALCDVGAYGYAMSSHFLNRPRPAEVVLHNGETHLTTRRETFEDLVATQNFS
jgi:diaminopimelate decarboxylase